MEFDSSAFEDLAWWIEQDRSQALRTIRLVREIQRDPFSGLGKARALEARIGWVLVETDQSGTSARISSAGRHDPDFGLPVRLLIGVDPTRVMTISNEGGGLSGAILFYLIRGDENQPVRSNPGIPEPLFRLRAKGDTLRFEVSHKRSHGARTANDSPVKFRLVIKSPEEGVLHNDNDPETPGGYRIVRDKAP